jgi:glycosyltransferase involved in cell wall biosynthesis
MINLGGACHFYNEELLLPGFVKHHLPIFQEMIMVDHNSTDSSVEIIKSLAPHWKVVKSNLANFGAHENDAEIIEWEKTLKTEYKQILNVTEWIWHPDYLDYLQVEFSSHPEVQAIGMKQIVLVDDTEGKPLLDPLYLNRTTGFVDEDTAFRRWRFVHKAEHGHYGLGRHNTDLPTHFDHNLFLIYWHLSPFPECLPRKLQIGPRQPLSDVQSLLGFQHQTTEERLRSARGELPKNNLLEDLRFSVPYHYNIDKI